MKLFDDGDSVDDPLRLRKSAPVQTSWTKIARRLN